MKAKIEQLATIIKEKIGSKKVYYVAKSGNWGEIPFNKGFGSVQFFRTDRESSGKIELPPSNRDLSRERNHLSGGISFFKELASFNVVHTDRLHIAIAACLLNREVHIYPGAYFKNEAIYQSSIKPYLDNVYFYKDDTKIQILS